MHLVRVSLRYCSWKDRKTIAGELRKIYTAPSVEAAADALDTFELEYGERYPGIVRAWRDAWERFSPFLAYPAVIRKIVYTTNMIVIWSLLGPVLDVVDEGLERFWLRGGCGYLTRSSTQVPGRFDVRSKGGGARLAA